jgi:hypothetical protein
MGCVKPLLSSTIHNFPTGDSHPGHKILYGSRVLYTGWLVIVIQLVDMYVGGADKHKSVRWPTGLPTRTSPLLLFMETSQLYEWLVVFGSGNADHAEFYRVADLSIQ